MAELVSILTSDVRRWIDTQIQNPNAKTGLCLKRFRSDVVIDKADNLLPGELVNVDGMDLRICDMQKKCHDGCDLSQQDCRLAGCHVFAVVDVGGGQNRGGSAPTPPQTFKKV